MWGERRWGGGGDEGEVGREGEGGGGTARLSNFGRSGNENGSDPFFSFRYSFHRPSSSFSSSGPTPLGSLSKLSSFLVFLVGVILWAIHSDVDDDDVVVVVGARRWL